MQITHILYRWIDSSAFTKLKTSHFCVATLQHLLTRKLPVQVHYWVQILWSSTISHRCWSRKTWCENAFKCWFSGMHWLSLLKHLCCHMFGRAVGCWLVQIKAVNSSLSLTLYKSRWSQIVHSPRVTFTDVLRCVVRKSIFMCVYVCVRTCVFVCQWFLVGSLWTQHAALSFLS